MSASLFEPAPTGAVARVALPVPVDELFDYSLPAALDADAQPGCRGPRCGFFRPLARYQMRGRAIRRPTTEAKMRIHHFFLAAGLLLATASQAVPAEDSSWTLRFHGAIIDSSAARTSVGSGLSSTVDVGGGLGIGAEYRISQRSGLEVSTLFAGLEISNSVTGRAGLVQSFELSMMPLTFAYLFHFDPGGRVDLFIAPTFSVVQYLDIETFIGGTGLATSVGVDTDAALGAAVGVDVPIGKRKWAVSSSLRYMKTGFESTDVDPVIVTIGFARRF